MKKVLVTFMTSLLLVGCATTKFKENLVRNAGIAGLAGLLMDIAGRL